MSVYLNQHFLLFQAQNHIEREKIITTSNLMEIKELATRQKLRELKEAVKSGNVPSTFENSDTVPNGHIQEYESHSPGKGHHSNEESKRMHQEGNSQMVNGWGEAENKTRPTTKDSGYGRSETNVADNTSNSHTKDNKFGSMISVRSGSSQVIPGPDFYAPKKQEKDPTSKWESNYTRPTTPSNLIFPESDEKGYSVKVKGGAIVKENETQNNKGDDSSSSKKMKNNTVSKSASESQRTEMNNDLIESHSKQIEEELLNNRNRQQKERYRKPPLFENLPKNTQTYMPSEYIHGMNQGEKFDARKMGLNSKNFDTALTSMLQEDNQNVYASYNDYDQFARTKAYKPSPYIQAVESTPPKKPKPPHKSRERQRERDERYASAEKRLTKGQDVS